MLEIGKFPENKSFEKLQMMKFGPEHIFLNNCLTYGRKWTQNVPNLEKPENYQVVLQSWAVFCTNFEQLLCMKWI